jgi:hypothetical protein
MVKFSLFWTKKTSEVPNLEANMDPSYSGTLVQILTRVHKFIIRKSGTVVVFRSENL